MGARQVTASSLRLAGRLPATERRYSELGQYMAVSTAPKQSHRPSKIKKIG